MMERFIQHSRLRGRHQMVLKLFADLHLRRKSIQKLVRGRNKVSGSTELSSTVEVQAPAPGQLTMKPTREAKEV